MHRLHLRARLRPRLHLALLSAGLLTACSAYQSEFQCNAPAGMPCRSLQAAYNSATTVPTLPPPPDPSRALPSDSSQSAEQWTPPVKTVWIAPYVDSAGRRHEASILRLVIFSGAKAVTAEPEFLIPPIPDTTEGGDTIAPPLPPPASPSTKMPPLIPGRTQGQEQSRSPVGTTPELAPGFFTPPAPQGGKPLTGFGLPGY